MRRRGYTYITCAMLLLLAVAVLPASAPREARQPALREALQPALRAARRPAPPQLPPVSMTCPMHPDVVQDKAGNCPLCKMALVPVRLESIWSCPVHSAVTEHAPGRCPICKRDLLQMTVALTWTCRGRSDINQIEPGQCPDGSPTVATRTLRPHGNHNPQHGGLFFMAADNWHHIEGTYPTPRLFRLYLYDDYGRALPADQVQQVRARLVTKETFDAKTRTTKELAAVPLVASRAGSYLEARIDTVPLPAEMTAKVRFKQASDEYRFDFTFVSVTKDPTVPARASDAARTFTVRDKNGPSPRATPAPAPQTPAAGLAQATTGPGAPDPSLGQLPIPNTVPEILAQLATRAQQVGELIDRGNFAAVFVPAFQGKALAIALEPRVDTLAPQQRDLAAPALQLVVRTAWQLDAAGDLGNRQQLQDAFERFASAVRDVTRAFTQ